MTIRELESHLNSHGGAWAVGTMDMEGWTREEVLDYKEWLWEQYEDLHRYDNISAEAAWDLA